MTTGAASDLSARTLLARGAREIAAGGVSESASRREAELLLRHALGCSREALLVRLQETVPAEVTGLYFQLVERRKGRVPVQYLIGTVEFYGLSFRVTPAVLIPRPETEGLVEEAISRLSRRAAPRIVDVGCGSGCIAIALASSLPRAEITAIDASAAALAVARENAIRNGVADRIRFLSGDLLAPLEGADRAGIDAVVSNPPYIVRAELPGLAPEVSRHEPRLALDGGDRGLEVVTRLVAEAREVLAPDGLLLLEIGRGQDEAVGALVEASGLALDATLADLAGIPRVVVARRP